LPVAIATHDVKFDNIAAVIFDKDGTLEDSLPFWREVGIRRARTIDAQIPGVGEPLLMAFGILDNTLDPQGLIAVGSRRENEIAAAAYIAETGRSWHESRQIAHQAFEEVSESKYLVKTTESAPLFDDVKQTLQSLIDAGLKIGILSADSTAEVDNFVKNHGLQNYIHSGIGVDDELTKPDPRLFEKACAALKVSPKQTLLVGDSIGDIAMAKAASAGTIGIDRHSHRLLQRADIQINSLLEIQVL
jgi:phosphoglycolate phosphatase